MKKNEFLQQFNISSEDFEKTKLRWEELVKIEKDYEQKKQDLEPGERIVVDELRKHEKVHTVRSRIKNPKNLIAKIVRKRIEDSTRKITLTNYDDVITDLVGVRALHLFKEDWIGIHDFITKTFNVNGDPQANIRSGDPDEFINRYKEKGCEVREHPDGYRSVHYQISTAPLIKSINVEIQVRTIFEEAWSEIDHLIRYPYKMNAPLLTQYLALFNRLAGSADEMGTFIMSLKIELEQRDSRIKELEKRIDDLSISQKEKTELKEEVRFPYILSGHPFQTATSGVQVTVQPSVKPSNLDFSAAPLTGSDDEEEKS